MTIGTAPKICLMKDAVVPNVFLRATLVSDYEHQVLEGQLFSHSPQAKRTRYERSLQSCHLPSRISWPTKRWPRLSRSVILRTFYDQWARNTDIVSFNPLRQTSLHSKWCHARLSCQVLVFVWNCKRHEKPYPEIKVSLDHSFQYFAALKKLWAQPPGTITEISTASCCPRSFNELVYSCPYQWLIWMGFPITMKPVICSSTTALYPPYVLCVCYHVSGEILSDLLEGACTCSIFHNIWGQVIQSAIWTTALCHIGMTKF